MTPDANAMPAESPETGAVWLSAAAAAQVLGVSEKTVWRRAKVGQLIGRKVTSARGGLVWEIALNPTGQPTGQTDRPDTKPTGQRLYKIEQNLTENQGFDAQTDRTSRADKTDRPTGQNGATDRTKEVELLEDALARERENAAFLRGVIEQLQRDGAETRATLRKALDGQPKQLTSGEQSGASSGEMGQVGTDTRAPDVPISSDSGADVVTTGAASNGADLSSYGALADWLENEILER
jgi:hypothetical protein